MMMVAAQQRRRQSLLLVLQTLLLLGCLVINVPVVNAGKYVLSIEPYVGEWCSAQFPEAGTALQEATNGHGMATMIKERSYKLLEPYAAQYCFDIFGHDQLKGVNKDKFISEIRQRGGSSIQIEPYLMEWGQKAMLSPTSGNGALAVPEVEQFVINWCIKGQFRHEMKQSKGGYEKALEDSGRYRTTAQPIEIHLASWCFDQFPVELSNLNQESSIQQLAADSKKIVKIEPYLMKWEIANFHLRNHPDMKETSKNSQSPNNNKTKSSSGSRSWGGFFFKFILVVGGIVVGIGYIDRNYPHITQAANERIQQLVEQQRSRRTGGGLAQFGGSAPMMMMPPYDHHHNNDQAGGVSYNPLNNNNDPMIGF